MLPIFSAIGICALLLLATIVYQSPGRDVLNYFDPPKLMIWGVLAVVLAWAWRRRFFRPGQSVLIVLFSLMVWMIARTLCRSNPLVELDVLFTWLLPFLFFALGAGISQKRYAKIIGGSLVFAGALQVIIMMLQRAGVDPFFAEITSVMDYVPGRMIGTIGYHNQAVDFLALSSVGVLLLTSRARWFVGWMVPRQLSALVMKYRRVGA